MLVKRTENSVIISGVDDAREMTYTEILTEFFKDTNLPKGLRGFIISKDSGSYEVMLTKDDELKDVLSKIFNIDESEIEII